MSSDLAELKAPRPKVAPPRRQTARRGRDGEPVSRLWMVACTAAVVVAAVYFLLPVVWLLIASTKSAGDLFSTPGFAFASFHLWDNLVNLSKYDGGIFWRWCLNSVIYSVFGSALTTAVCAATGYALAIYRFRGRKTLLAAVLASMLVPGTVIAQPPTCCRSTWD